MSYVDHVVCLSASPVKKPSERELKGGRSFHYQWDIHHSSYIDLFLVSSDMPDESFLKWKDRVTIGRQILLMICLRDVTSLSALFG